MPIIHLLLLIIQLFRISIHVEQIFNSFKYRFPNRCTLLLLQVLVHHFCSIGLIEHLCFYVAIYIWIVYEWVVVHVSLGIQGAFLGIIEIYVGV